MVRIAQTFSTHTHTHTHTHHNVCMSLYEYKNNSITTNILTDELSRNSYKAKHHLGKKSIGLSHKGILTYKLCWRMTVGESFILKLRNEEYVKIPRLYICKAKPTDRNEMQEKEAFPIANIYWRYHVDAVT